MKLPTRKFRNTVALLAWALMVAFVLTLILFGALIAAAYVADELMSSSTQNARSSGRRCHVPRKYGRIVRSIESETWTDGVRHEIADEEASRQ